MDASSAADPEWRAVSQSIDLVPSLQETVKHDTAVWLDRVSIKSRNHCRIVSQSFILADSRVSLSMITDRRNAVRNLPILNARIPYILARKLVTFERYG